MLENGRIINTENTESALNLNKNGLIAAAHYLIKFADAFQIGTDIKQRFIDTDFDDGSKARIDFEALYFPTENISLRLSAETSIDGDRSHLGLALRYNF